MIYGFNHDITLNKITSLEFLDQVTKWFELLLYYIVNKYDEHYGLNEYIQAKSDMTWYTSDLFGNGIKLLIFVNITNSFFYKT